MTNLLEKMKEELILRGLSKHTQRAYLRHPRELSEYHNREVETLSDTDIKKYLLHLLQDRHLSAVSYNCALFAIKFFYRNVLDRQLDERNFPSIKEPSKLPDILSVAEIKKMFSLQYNIKFRTFLMLTYSAGLRISEAINLKITDIDSDRMLIHIRNAKGQKDRYVTLSPLILEQLRTYWRTCHPRDWLFPGRTADKPVSAKIASLHYQKLKSMAGIHKLGGLHTLRHSFAVHLLDLGENVYTIKNLLGHASLSSTAHYLQFTAKQMNQAKSPLDMIDFNNS